MTTVLADINVGLPDDRKHESGIFNPYVVLERHNQTEEAAQKLIDEILPRRRIQRRHSTLDVAEIVNEDDGEVQNVVDLSTPPPPPPPPAKRRRVSMDVRSYFAPLEVRSVIQSIRQTGGALNYRSTFHSTQQRQKHVAAIATSSTTTSSEANSSPNLSTNEHNYDDVDDMNDNTWPENEASHGVTESSTATRNDAAHESPETEADNESAGSSISTEIDATNENTAKEAGHDLDGSSSSTKIDATNESPETEADHESAGSSTSTEIDATSKNPANEAGHDLDGSSRSIDIDTINKIPARSVSQAELQRMEENLHRLRMNLGKSVYFMI